MQRSREGRNPEHCRTRARTLAFRMSDQVRHDEPLQSPRPGASLNLRHRHRLPLEATTVPPRRRSPRLRSKRLRAGAESETSPWPSASRYVRTARNQDGGEMSLQRQQLKYTKIGAIAGLGSVFLGLWALSSQAPSVEVRETPTILTNYYVHPAESTRVPAINSAEPASNVGQPLPPTQEPTPPDTVSQPSIESSRAPGRAAPPASSETHPQPRRSEAVRATGMSGQGRTAASTPTRRQLILQEPEPERTPALEFTHVAR
jgi:hypothetical protein